MPLQSVGASVSFAYVADSAALAVVASPANMDTTIAIARSMLKSFFVISLLLFIRFLGYGYVITRGSKRSSAHRRTRFASAGKAEYCIRRTSSGIRKHGSPLLSAPENVRGPPKTATADHYNASSLEMTCRDGDRRLPDCSSRKRRSKSMQWMSFQALDGRQTQCKTRILRRRAAVRAVRGERNAGKVRKTFLRGRKVAGKGMYAGNNAYERVRQGGPNQRRKVICHPSIRFEYSTEKQNNQEAS